MDGLLFGPMDKSVFCRGGGLLLFGVCGRRWFWKEEVVEKDKVFDENSIFDNDCVFYENNIFNVYYVFDN